MMNTKWMILAAVVTMAFVAGDAFANSEDQIIGVVERVLNVVADFLAKVFQSIADAVRSVWSPSN